MRAQIESSRKASRAAAEQAFVRSAELLKMIAHPQRLRMLELLLHDRYTVGELAEACGLPSHMASEHLRLMQRSGLLARNKQGRRVYYDIAQRRLARSIIACAHARSESGAV